MARYCKAAYDKHYPVSAAGIWADSNPAEATGRHQRLRNCAQQEGAAAGTLALQRFISVPVFDGDLVRNDRRRGQCRK